jgi:hypothetical protein
MADADSSGSPDRATSFPLVAGGLLLATVVIVVAFVVDPEIGIPVLILAAICLVAALGYRLLTNRSGGDADSSDNIPRQEPRGDRPLGDTPDAHDEINPHDLPLDNPGREVAQEQVGDEGTTRGPRP